MEENSVNSDKKRGSEKEEERDDDDDDDVNLTTREKKQQPGYITEVRRTMVCRLRTAIVKGMG